MFSPWKLESLVPAALRSDPVPPPPLVPYTLAHLIAWLETKSPSEEYEWEDPCGCLIAQYGLALGLPRVTANLEGLLRSVYQSTRERMLMAPGGRDGMCGYIARDGERTFGDALNRARRLQAAQ